MLPVLRLIFRVTVALTAHVVIKVTSVERRSPRRHRQLFSRRHLKRLNFISYLTLFLGTLLTWHSVHVIKLLAIDANPVIFLGLAPSDEQLPGSASVTNAALHASAEHVLAVLDAIENDMVPTVNLNGHHLNLCIAGGTWRTALNVSRA